MLTLDDGKQKLKLEDFDMRPLRSHSAPAQPTLNLQTQHIPDKVGDWYFGAEVGTKTYQLAAKTRFRDIGELEKRLDKLNAFLFDEKMQPKLLKISFDYSEKFFHARLATNFVPDVTTILEEIPITFVSHDPTKYAESNAYDPEIPLRYDEGNKYGIPAYPNTEAFKWLYFPVHYSSLFNYSNFEADLKIKINGTIKNASVTNLSTNVTMDLPDITNGEIVIDSETLAMTVNGNDLILSTEFIKLKAGLNGFAFNSTQAKATVTFGWLHKFM